MNTELPLLKRLSYSLTDLSHEELIALQATIEKLRAQMRLSGIQANLESIHLRDFASLASKPTTELSIPFVEILLLIEALQPKELTLLEALTIYILNKKDFKASLGEILRRNTTKVDNPAGITEFIMPVLVLSDNTAKND